MAYRSSPGPGARILCWELSWTGAQKLKENPSSPVRYYILLGGHLLQGANILLLCTLLFII